MLGVGVIWKPMDVQSVLYLAWELLAKLPWVIWLWLISNKTTLVVQVGLQGQQGWSGTTLCSKIAQWLYLLQSHSQPMNIFRCVYIGPPVYTTVQCSACMSSNGYVTWSVGETACWSNWISCICSALETLKSSTNESDPNLLAVKVNHARVTRWVVLTHAGLQCFWIQLRYKYMTSDTVHHGWQKRVSWGC